MRILTGIMCAAVGLGVIGAAGAGLHAAHAAQAKGAAKPGSYAMAVRRLTESQYRNVITDTFGAGITMNARFEPDRREEGLQAIGNGKLSVTTSGFEQYFALASSISGQMIDPKRRAALGCTPADPKAPDAKCTTLILEKYGPGLFRRPLTRDEIAGRLKIAEAGTARSADFYEGVRLALASLLTDPEFLFRVEEAEPDPAKKGASRLDAWTKASRLSFLMWDSGPDAELMAAAASGAIHTDAGLKAQIARMSASPRVKAGAQAFFTDMLQFDAFDSLTKDSAAYPKYSQKVADSAREQTLRTLLDLVIDQNGDYRDIFTSNDVWMNRSLAAVYKVPYNSKQPWARHTFQPDDGRSGILTQVTFLSLFSHPAASSPTKRGVKIHEIFLCQPTPEPPADVDFSKVQALEKGTVRIRLLAHMENEGCATCHRVSDPMGLALEHFDGLGQKRTLENGQPIDVSATIKGASVIGAPGVGKALHNDPAIPACLVRNVYAYGVGHTPDDRDEDYLAAQTKAFAAGGYRYRNLLVSIASSPEYLKAAPPAGLAPRVLPKAAPPKPAPPKTIAAIPAKAQGAVQ